MVDPKKGSMIPLDPIARLNAISGITMDPMPKSIARSIIPPDLTKKCGRVYDLKCSHDKEHDRIYGSTGAHDINAVANMCIAF